MSASWRWLETQTRHLMLPVNPKYCLVSRFLPENLEIVKLTQCWHCLPFHTLHLNWSSKLAPVTLASEQWWMLVILILVYKGEDNLLSIMLTINVSIHPLLISYWWWWNDVVGTQDSLSLSSSMLVLELLLECWKYPGLMGQHNRYISACVHTTAAHLPICRAQYTGGQRTNGFCQNINWKNLICSCS